jgi:hypothetical protein
MYKESIYSQRTDKVQGPTEKEESPDLVIIWTMHINGQYVGTFFPLTLQLVHSSILPGIFMGSKGAILNINKTREI